MVTKLILHKLLDKRIPEALPRNHLNVHFKFLICYESTSSTHSLTAVPIRACNNSLNSVIAAVT